MILRLDDVQAEIVLLVDVLGKADRVRSLGDDDGLSLEVRDALEAAAGLGQPAWLTDEGRNGERDLFLTLLVVGRAAALDIDGAVLDQRNPVR